MSNTSNVLKIFASYGELHKLSKNNYYAFICNPKKIFPEDTIFYKFKPIKFLIVLEDDFNCYLSCFGLANEKKLKNHTLYIINNINSSLEYGKYILDDDGDVNWEFKFNYSHSTRNDIQKYFSSLIESVFDLLILSDSLLREDIQ